MWHTSHLVFKVRQVVQIGSFHKRVTRFCGNISNPSHFPTSFEQDHHALLPSIAGKMQMQLQLPLLAIDRRTLHVHVLLGCRCEQSPPRPAEYTKETQDRIANKEKMRRLNIGSGYWSVPCAEEETPGRFGGR